MAGFVFHVMNRSARRGPLLESPADYETFIQVLREALDERPIRLLSFCAMPNHFHLIAHPETDSQLPQFMKWLTGTHAVRWRKAHDTVGEGVVYQGRYKAIPVHTDEYFLTVVRYVERNPVRARLVDAAQDWRWSSFYHRDVVRSSLPLAEWPVQRPARWTTYVNEPQAAAEIAAIRRCVNNGCALGNARWQEEVAKTLGIPGFFRSRGRPRRNGD